MAELKLVLADPKTGKCHQKSIEGDACTPFFGKKIGETLKGEVIDLTGYEFKITGGTDKSGFPMRSDIEGSVKRRILDVEGVGIHPTKKKINVKKPGRRRFKGMRRRKTVAGNTVSEGTAQLNLVITKAGKQPLDAPAEAAPEAEAPKEEAKEEKAEAPKEEAKAKEPKPEKPADEASTDVKSEDKSMSKVDGKESTPEKAKEKPSEEAKPAKEKEAPADAKDKAESKTKVDEEDEKSKKAENESKEDKPKDKAEEKSE